MKIIEDYIIFGGSEFLKSHGASLANIIDTIVGNVNDKGLLTALPIVDLLIQVTILCPSEVTLLSRVTSGDVGYCEFVGTS